MTKQKFEVQRHNDLIYVVRQNGDIPHPGPDEVVLQMVACGMADIRAATGNKTVTGEANRYTTLGHEFVSCCFGFERSRFACQALQVTCTS